MTTRSQAKVNHDISVNKAYLAAYLINSWVKIDSDYQQKENVVLRNELADQIEHTVALRRQVARLTRQNTTANAAIQSLLSDQRFMDATMREIFTNHPSICWEYRDRLSYSEIIPVDPEQPQDLYDRLFGSDDDDDESLEERLEREYERERDM